jgi:GNAT superfamily N-acetyltransferase
MAIVIRRLEERDEVKNFDCGDEALNHYLKRHAWSNQAKSSIGVSYVAIDEGAPRAVLGYFTLAMASVPREAFPKKYVRGLPPYNLPLILLARLAVDRRFAGRGLGHALISETFRISLCVADEVGCRCTVTDAYRDRISWYARYGFVPIEGAAGEGPQRMFLDIRTVRAALRRKNVQPGDRIREAVQYPPFTLH